MSSVISNYKISILMNCRDGEQYLKQAIDSVYNQSYQNFEIIFIDNQSKDDTAKIAKSYDQRLKYYLTPVPMSLYEARNYAIQFCTGDFFCVLDADDYWQLDKLYSQVKLISENPEITFAYGSANYFYNNRNYKTIVINWLNGIRTLLKKQGYRSFEDLIENYDMNFQTVIIKMEYVKKCGFNPIYNYIGDFDLHLRIMSTFNVQPFYMKKFLSTTRIHNSQLTTTTPGKWLREVKHLLVNVIIPSTSKSGARKFMKEISKKKFTYYLCLRKPGMAISSLKVHIVTDLYLMLLVCFKISTYYLGKLQRIFFE